MNWDAVVAVSEVIGVVAVIASIIYLAIQVKQSTDLARAGMVHDTSASWASYHAMIAADAGLADIYVRGVKGEALTPAETLRFESVIQSYMTLLEDSDHQYKANLYFDEDDDEDLVEYLAPTFKELFTSPVGRNWWARIAASSTTPSLYAKMNRIILKWDTEERE